MVVQINSTIGNVQGISGKWDVSKEPQYLINNERNNELYAKYEKLVKEDNKVVFGGRLGQYKYYDMDKVIVETLKYVKEELYN